MSPFVNPKVKNRINFNSKAFYFILDEFIRALRLMNTVTLPPEVTIDDNNNNKTNHTVEEQPITIESTFSFLISNDES